MSCQKSQWNTESASTASFVMIAVIGPVGRSTSMGWHPSSE